MHIVESYPYRKLVYALKSNDVKRQYPPMLGRFFDFIKIEEEPIEQKCKVFYDFVSKVENRKVLIHYYSNLILCNALYTYRIKIFYLFHYW